MSPQPSILFIDKEKDAVAKLISALNESFSNNFHLVTNTADLSAKTSINEFDIVFIDVTFENKETGLKILKKLNLRNSQILVAAIPENDDYLTSKVLELNPFFYINKPYNQGEVTLALKRAIEKSVFSNRTQRNNKGDSNFCGIIGQSPVMLELFDLITRVADDDYATVLIRGESGTGKELVAKAIHAKSSRKTKNFVPVNCAAIPDDLLESELFGHVKGAFTGATQNKQGRIQYADGGTLFLDEIGDMKPTLQAKLLRVLQEKEFEPVGGLQPTPVDTRILAATHCDLEQLVREGVFREDLYYRLSVIPLNIPPLSSRKEDIPLLINSFISSYTDSRGRTPFSFSRSALETLLQYNWRGNVRELENLIQHMSILYSGKTVERSDLPKRYVMKENISLDDVSHILTGTSNDDKDDPAEMPSFSFDDFFISENEIDFNEVINNFEKKLIINALRATEGNKKEAARLLKLKRTTLLEKIKKKKLSPDSW